MNSIEKLHRAAEDFAKAYEAAAASRSLKWKDAAVLIAHEATMWTELRNAALEYAKRADAEHGAPQSTPSIPLTEVAGPHL